MPDTLEAFTQNVNFTRYQGQQQGHYESFFQRANHPRRPLAFWIRYTIFSPSRVPIYRARGRPNDALGELWAIFFNGETGRHVAVKKEIALNSLLQAIKAKGAFDYFTWNFASATQEVAVAGAISAPREAFVGLNYYNPPGGNKHCLNTKIAFCELRLMDRQLNKEETLYTRHRAAFEILTDDREHGVEIHA